jgi:hypothetical protein
MTKLVIFLEERENTIYSVSTSLEQFEEESKPRL